MREEVSELKPIGGILKVNREHTREMFDSIGEFKQVSITQSSKSCLHAHINAKQGVLLSRPCPSPRQLLREAHA